MSPLGHPTRVTPLARSAEAEGLATPALDPAAGYPGTTTIASGYTARFPALNRTLARHLRDSTVHGVLDVDLLMSVASQYYDEVEAERRGIVRSMQMMSEEAQELTRELREQTAGQLQAILDHVKDVILTVDDQGYIQSFNPTGERVFGYAQAEVIGRPLAALLPELAQGPRVAERLDLWSMQNEDTHVDLAGHEATGCSKSGERFAVELGVSKAMVGRRSTYVLCLRDATERKLVEAATRESEARYRLLVENAPEAILVLDVDSGHFVDCNDHATRFFKLDRPALLALGFEGLSVVPAPEEAVASGMLDLDGHISRALAGEMQVFERLYHDALGREIACEVRLTCLPSASRRLVRGSITDISERRRAEAHADGERRVLERLASSAPLEAVLGAITVVVEGLHLGDHAAIRLLDEDGLLRHAVAPRLPREFCAAMDEVPVALRYGSCAAAVYLGREVIVADIATDPYWEYRREAALRAGFRACWANPIRGADGVIIGTLALYLAAPATPGGREAELLARMTQLAGIAIERRRADAALRVSEARFRGLFEHVVEGVYQSAPDGRLRAVNPALVRMLGYGDASELTKLESTAALYVDPVAYTDTRIRLLMDGEVRGAEYELRRRDGEIITVVENARLVRGDDGSVVGSEGTLWDVTARRRAELEVVAEKERAQVTLQSIGDAVITTDATGMIDYLNPIAEQLTGWTVDDARGQALGGVLKVVNEVTREGADCLVTRCLREGQVIQGHDQAALIDRGGREVAIQNSAAPIRDGTGQLLGTVVVFRDVSRERRLRRALSYQATHDALTGLLNRREFEHRLHAALAETRCDGGPEHALVYVDLDQFKVVNDTCGHPAGDRLLKQVTSLLQSRTRGTDTLARLGGDEFGVLLKDCGIEQATRIAEGLRQALREFRYEWDGQPIRIGASIGVVAIDQRSESVAAVMSGVDIACYAAKDGGRNRVHVYETDNVPARHKEMQWVSRLQRACDEGRLEIHFQPIRAIARNAEDRPRVELMLRLRDEDGSLVHPIEFIPPAERYNMMPAIDRWVLKQALGTVLGKGQVGANASIAINLSATTLADAGFLEFVLAELAALDLHPGALCFEITETAALASLRSVVYFMRELKARGVSFALDDFGAGLSSFAYLKTLPVDYLKIDGQFIENIVADPIDRSMVEAICRVARAAGIRTIAERVETEAVLEVLTEIGVDYVQGFLIARPAPLAALGACLETDWR